MSRTRQVKVVETKDLPKRMGLVRYVLVDAETGLIADDARGYGYTSPEKAERGWRYKGGIKFSRDDHAFFQQGDRGPVLGKK